MLPCITAPHERFGNTSCQRLARVHGLGDCTFGEQSNRAVGAIRLSQRHAGTVRVYEVEVQNDLARSKLSLRTLVLARVTGVPMRDGLPGNAALLERLYDRLVGKGQPLCAQIHGCDPLTLLTVPLKIMADKINTCANNFTEVRKVG